MKSLILPILLSISILSCGSEGDEKQAVNNLDTGNLIAGQADSIYNQTNYFPDKTQFAIALIKDGKVSYYGCKRINDTLITIDNNDKAFEIGSLTKVFTTTLLANFVLNGEVNLDSNINNYFRFNFNNNQKFTFKELANHTSGLPRLPSNMRFQAVLSPKNPYKSYTDQKLEEYLKNDISTEYQKGSKSEYSNLGMGLLSYTLRKISGKTFEQMAKEKIFDKYKMLNSTTQKSLIKGILVQGLDEKGRATPNWDPGALVGIGGIYSTVEDLSKFAIAQFDSSNKELSLTRFKTFKENESRDVGLGWFIINKKNGSKWYWHNGGTGGFSSSIAIDIEKKNGVIVLSNISSYHKNFINIDKLCFSLLTTMDF